MTVNDKKNASELDMSEQGLTLLKQVETLRLKPYDDQTGKEPMFGLREQRLAMGI